MVAQSKGCHQRPAKVDNSIRREAERFATTSGMTSASAVMLDSSGSG